MRKHFYQFLNSLGYTFIADKIGTTTTMTTTTKTTTTTMNIFSAAKLQNQRNEGYTMTYYK